MAIVPVIYRATAIADDTDVCLWRRVFIQCLLSRKITGNCCFESFGSWNKHIDFAINLETEPLNILYHTRLTISRVIWRWILSWPVMCVRGQTRSLKNKNDTTWKLWYGFLFDVIRYDNLFQMQPQRLKCYNALHS